MSQATLGSTPYRNSDLFSGYYLEERIDDLDAWDCDAEAEAVFEELQTLWEGEGGLVSGYNEDTLLGSWIDKVLDALGYDTIQETSLPDTGGYIDRVLYDDAADRRDAMAMKQDGQLSGAFGRASALLEAKQWDTDFTQRFSEQRSYRDASHQVKYYLEHTPESLQWGVLTDGKKWRLYGTKDYATETYYEVDLPEILESGDLQEFKYFYLFFRPEAFREVGGSTFLETVWSESETAAQELGEDLQDNVFTALRVLGEGFVETNDLDIDPEDEAALAELKEQSLVLLYRLMFVLYAESRHLIDPEDPQARAEYRENFSLDEIRLDIHDSIESGETFDGAYSEYSHSIWGQLQDLFRLVDSGEESLGVSAYNGGLFDRDQHEFLAEHSVSDRYIAEVIYRLGTTETVDGSFALADYADLDTRHLGTIYEGLLEHEFRIAPEDYAAVAEDGGQVWEPATEVSVADAVETVEQGELYVVNDEGERKATGAYYTPDYVVSYIVEETVDPLIEELEADLDDQGLERGTQEYVVAFWNGVTDLRVLDPAMGSGHFLTSATEYLASAVMERVRELETATLFDEQQIRREISRECIYGVDLNGMAVELAKLSMWLETLATDQPLAFLDHHLKAGNSLVGSDISEVLGTDEPSGTEQATLFDDFSRTRRQALEHVMDLVEDLLAIDNETVADAKRMEDLYAEIREDDLYERLFGMANVHTAERFDLDVPDGAYKQMANAIDDEAAWAAVEDEDWYTTAQAMAEEEQFFHWELEYPEVFFGEDGERKDGAGFDAVVGNPPWLNAWTMTEDDPEYRDHLKALYSEWDSLSGHWDLYVPFVIQALKLCREEGRHSFILPSPVLAEKYATNLREELLSNHSIESILTFGEENVFDNVDRQSVIYTLEKGVKGGRKEDLRQAAIAPFRYESIAEVPHETWLSRYNHQIRIDEDFLTYLPILERIEEEEEQLGNYLYVNYGAQVSSNEKGKFSKSDVVFEGEIEGGKRFFEGRDISRYHCGWSGKYLDYRYDEMYGPRHPDLFESDKIAVSVRTDGDGKLVAAIDDTGKYCDHTVVVCCPYSELQEADLQLEFEGFERRDSNPNLTYLVAQLNSSLMSWFFQNKFATGALQGSYSDVWPASVRGLPIRVSPPNEPVKDMISEESSNLLSERDINTSETLDQALTQLTMQITDSKKQRGSLNLNLLDHLGTYDDGQPLSEIGFTQPPENAADSILQATTEQHANLRVGDCEVVRESSSTVEIRLTARYKPEDDDAHETDQWGYTETELLPALRITDLTNTEADLIEAFVPVAVDEAGGFAGFRETATKTNSLVDRLRGLTLPRVDGVADGLAQYRETKQRADELDAKIQRTDDLIDEIVYELYGLTEEEIEIVEDSVN